MNNYRKTLSAVSELRDTEAQLVVVRDIKQEAQERMLRDDPAPNDADWHKAATEYAIAHAEMNRLAARVRILKGRVHFRALMASQDAQRIARSV